MHIQKHPTITSVSVCWLSTSSWWPFFCSICSLLWWVILMGTSLTGQHRSGRFDWHQSRGPSTVLLSLCSACCRHLERARIVFAIENEMSTEERELSSNKYWTNIDDQTIFTSGKKLTIHVFAVMMMMTMMMVVWEMVLMPKRMRLMGRNMKKKITQHTSKTWMNSIE